MKSSTTSSSLPGPNKRDVRRRAETPTRELLRRVQKRSSAGMAMAPPPPPTFPLLIDGSAKAKEEKSGRSQTWSSAARSARQSPAVPLKRDQSSERRSSEEVEEELADQVDSIREELDNQDEPLSHFETHSSAVAETSNNNREHSSSSNNRGGLTRAAAYKLEREFASQERILQGLQKDNEAKTVEVERLRRERKIMAEHFACQYGAEDWETMVFGPSASSSSSLPAVSSTYEKFGSGSKREHMAHESPSTLKSMRKVLDSINQFSSPAQSYKGSLSRLAATTGVHEVAANDASFYSADESFAFAAKPAPVPSSHASPSPPNADTDGGPNLAHILATIETQRLFIKGFERSNALKLVECREQVSLAREKEELWTTRLEETLER